MRWFAPVVHVAAPERSGDVLSRLFGRKSSSSDGNALEHFGGVPLGLAPDRWPHCADCGKSQSLLAQLQHDAERLDLGGEGRVLLVFQCSHDPGMCESWDQSAGANAAFVIEASELGPFPTPIPDDNPPLDPTIEIVGWVAHDDDIPDSERPLFMADASLSTMTDEQRERSVAATRLGSVPFWIQNADEAPVGWRFAGQLDSTDQATYPGNSAPNFGDSGIAYLFLRDQGDGLPEARMFWQCC